MRVRARRATEHHSHPPWRPPPGGHVGLTRGLYGTNESPGSAGDREPFSSAVAAPARGPCGSDWAKIVRTRVATIAWADFGTRVSRLRMAWVRHRCQVAPGSTAAMACLRPSWASETTRDPGQPPSH